MNRIIHFVLIAMLCNLYLGSLFAQEIHLDKYTSQTKTKVKIASVSIFPEKWNKEANWKAIERLVRQSVDKYNPDIVVTPEGALDGYVINEVNAIEDTDQKKETVKKFLDLGEELNGPYIKKSRALADELDIFLVLGFLERSKSIHNTEHLLHNTAIMIDPDGEIIGRYSKTHFAQGYEINPKCYVAGEEYPVFQTPFGKIGMLICYDRQLPEPARILALKGSQILLLPSYGSYTDEHGWNSILMRARAYENQMPLVFSHPNQSLLINQDGDIVKMGDSNEAVCYEINTDSKNYEGRFKNRRPPSYKTLIEGKDPASGTNH